MRKKWCQSPLARLLPICLQRFSLSSVMFLFMAAGSTAVAGSGDRTQTIAEMPGGTARNVYFLSGLGADQRVFRKLELDKHFQVRHIEWIRPLRNESLRSYAG